MIFTLEALEAKHGDSLILHYGPAGSPSFIVIDGGPGGVYKNSLRPRLDQLKKKWQPNKDDALPLRLLMVSHIDDDHINGVLTLLGEQVDRAEDSRPLTYSVLTLWHNSFDDIIGNRGEDLFRRLGAAMATAAGEPSSFAAGLSRPAAAVVASIGQGRQLRDHAARLGISLNEPFDGLVVAPKTGRKVLSWENGLKLSVLGPGRGRVEALHAEWEKALKKAKGSQGQALAAAYADQSIFNLSSVVVLAEVKNKRMLLTGDARGDDILAGLAGAGLLKKGKFHVDLLKLPHHGSDRNVETDFFRKVTADHYVVSANGEYGNPEIATLKMISEARGNEEFALYFTNAEGKEGLGKRLRDFFQSEKKRGRKYRVVFREKSDLSVEVDLLDPITY